MKPFDYLLSPFGDTAFGAKAERFARFFGTPKFLIGQTGIVATWIALNMAHVVAFDRFPFILLNLAFSLQAAYAAPLILLAQTRQADRDKALADADAKHREALAEETLKGQELTQQGLDLLRELLEKNTELTTQNMTLVKKIEELTAEIRDEVRSSDPPAGPATRRVSAPGKTPPPAPAPDGPAAGSPGSYDIG
jgi:uncharacterized membrane protein